MITAYMTQPATLHTWVQGSKDAAGDYQSGYTDSTVAGIELQQPDRPAEIRQGETVLVSTWVAFLPPDVTITAMDELTVAGVRYAVNGTPWLVRNPRTGLDHHWVVQLRKAE